MRGLPAGTVKDPYVVTEYEGELPQPGDYFLFPNTGSCWEILDVYPRRAGVKRLRTACVKLEQDEVTVDQPLKADGTGRVIQLEWMRKRR